MSPIKKKKYARISAQDKTIHQAKMRALASDLAQTHGELLEKSREISRKHNRCVF
jgi:hypothetical protein